jgi:hypothetical protein
MTKLPDGWPPLPISILQINPSALGIDSIIAALQYSDRVFEINLWDVGNPQLEQISAAMQQPFPALTNLALSALNLSNDTALVIPDSFLGGSAPCLEFLMLITSIIHRFGIAVSLS